jgi:hypothetical protein
MLLPMLAEWLCDNEATDTRAARIINGMHLVSLAGSWVSSCSRSRAHKADLVMCAALQFLMPTMNPDGFEARTRENAGEMTELVLRQ